MAVAEEFDVLLVGGGLVGASLGCALAGSGLRVGLAEAALHCAAGEGDYDDRVIALSAGSQRVFQAMDVWRGIAAEAEPILSIHISERGRFGVAVLEAEQERVAALGYVSPARCIGRALQARLAQVAEVTNLSPARFAGLRLEGDLARVALDTDDGSLEVSARLVVAADGARSPVRKCLGIPLTRWSYGQSAVIANVSMNRHHQNIAYERFTEEGPVAMLPMTEGRCALVLTVADRESGTLLAMSEESFAGKVAERFGGRLGRVEKVGRREVHPLELVKARAHFRSRVALIGNAAHTLHPVAGQGFNLGLRDVAVLAEVIVDAVRAGEDPGHDQNLSRYARWRGADQWRTAGFTDALVRVFGNPLLPVRLARGLGLLAFQALPPVKRLLARQAMGLTGPLPRLARGLAL
jgi:2-octaprenyl-6-methoxyphenol hydroxylase